MEDSGCIDKPSLGSGYESGLGPGSHDEPDNVPTMENHHYLLASLLVQLIGSVAIIVPATVVIATIIYQKLFCKPHYCFVFSLMVCDIIIALTFALLHSFLYVYNQFAPVKATVSCYVESFFYIAPVASGFMVVNLTIDATLAVTYPLTYKKLMTKTKVFVLCLLAWLLAASLTLPSLSNPSLDVEVVDLCLCPHTLTLHIPFLIGRFVTGVLVVVLSTYLYWSVYKAKRKFNYLTGNDSTSQSLVVKLKKNIRFSITLLLIVTVDCSLRILQPAMSVILMYFDLMEMPTGTVILVSMSWVEYIDHPVVYGLMLHDVYKSLCCKSSNSVAPS